MRFVSNHAAPDLAIKPSHFSQFSLLFEQEGTPFAEPL